MSSISRELQMTLQAAYREAVYRQWDLPTHQAFAAEGRQGVPWVAAEGASGAARFVDGAGRHGSF